MNLKLYNYFRSSASYRVRIALHLKNLEFEYLPIHLVNNGGEHHKADYKKINPAGEVPALIHAGQIITQSVAIIEYLDEEFPSPNLFPHEPSDRARVRQIVEHINCLQPLQNLQVLQHLESEFGLNQEGKEKWVSKWLSRVFMALEEITQHTAGLYCVGDQITAADLFLIPQIFAGERFKVDITPYRNLARINLSCLNHDAFKKAHPMRQIDTPPDLKI
jgi:maleylacetoacetate isomerase/maleylpyruvate isomerase